MRVLLADDQPEVCSALRLLLEQELAHQVVGEATNGDSLMVAAQVTSPDLLMLDWELPGSSITRLLAALRCLRPNLIVVALSGYPEAGAEALNAGANAFASKGDSPERLLSLLRSISAATMNARGGQRC